MFDIFLVDFLADHEQPDLVLHFDHDPHLVEDELHLFSSVHGPVGLDLDVLQESRGFFDVGLRFVVFDQKKGASSEFDLVRIRKFEFKKRTSRKIFFSQTSLIVLMWVSLVSTSSI